MTLILTYENGGYKAIDKSEALAHFGVPGMKWKNHVYAENPTMNDMKKRYYKAAGATNGEIRRSMAYESQSTGDRMKKVLKVAAISAAVVAVGGLLISSLRNSSGTAGKIARTLANKSYVGMIKMRNLMKPSSKAFQYLSRTNSKVVAKAARPFIAGGAAAIGAKVMTSQYARQRKAYNKLNM